MPLIIIAKQQNELTQNILVTDYITVILYFEKMF